jgi:hypothetical protein
MKMAVPLIALSSIAGIVLVIISTLLA